MKKFAAVFPGQGSQSVGMFADFIGNGIVRQTFDESSEALGFDIKKLCLEGPESELNRTEITQPAILTASVAACRVLRSRGAEPMAVAGHSLGEYSALVAAGVLSFTDAVKLVHLRGRAMQEAVPAGQGAMAAVLGLEDQAVIEACARVSAEGDAVWAANFNTPGQVVISGARAACERACAELAALGAKKVVPLAVSAPSHCPLMAPAAARLAQALGELQVNDARVPVYVNSRAEPLTGAADLTAALIAQLTGPVRWVETVRRLKADGAEVLIEVGPNRVLSGMNRRIDRSLGAGNVCDEASLEKTLEILA